MSGASSVATAAAVADATGGPRQAPAWLRRGVVLVLVALPARLTDVVDWANRTFGTAFQAEVVSDSLRLTPERIEQLATQLTPGVVGILSSLVAFVFQGFTLMLFAFYMSAQGPLLRRTVTSWFPPRRQPVIGTVWEIAVDKTGGYVVSRLLLAALSAVLTGAVLWLLGVPYWSYRSRSGPVSCRSSFPRWAPTSPSRSRR